MVAAAAGLGLAGGHAVGGSAPRASTGPRGTVLITGATVLTCAPVDDVRPDTDVLVRDGVIAGVGHSLPRPADVEVIDGGGALLMPGMVDTHRHAWQLPLAGLGANWDFDTFTEVTQGRAVPAYTAEDFRRAALASHLDALDAGVTTVLDYNHGLVTPDHAEASLRAARESGARVRFAWGHAAQVGNDPQRSWATDGDVLQVARDASLVGGLVSLQLALDASGEPGFPEEAAWRYAADNDLGVTAHTGLYGRGADALVDELRERGLLRPGLNFVHAAEFRPDTYEAIAASGGVISVATESECTFGQGRPATSRAEAAGVTFGLGSDTVTYQSGDILSAMRTTLDLDRFVANDDARAADAELPRHRPVDRMLLAGTLGGARSLGLAESIGSIEVGKRADLVLLRSSSPSFGIATANYPQAAAVLHAGRGDVDTVLVDGTVVKRDGTLVADTGPVLAELTDTRDRLATEIDLPRWRYGAA
ncbi:amidohydrolase family protein [Pseudonocardia nematodicida]|uniref:Amidohydrolase family protein n=1 Tax=Pseudonocardia nematodicida TaxID=1206997 RepID=A0ABV1KE43_9PSEU